MANQTGQKDQALITGRIMYGYDGTNAYPIAVNTAGVLAGIATTITKTVETELFAAASVAASTQTTSSILTLTPSVKKATIFISHGRASSAAFGTNGTEYRVEVSEAATATNQWRSIASVLASSAVAMTAAASANVAVGATTVVILSGTAVTSGDVMVWPSGTIEWFKVATPTGTASFTVENPLDFAHAAATATIIGGAEHFSLNLDVESVTRMRVFINNIASGTTQNIYSKIACITES